VKARDVADQFARVPSGTKRTRVAETAAGYGPPVAEELAAWLEWMERLPEAGPERRVAMHLSDFDSQSPYVKVRSELKDPLMAHPGTRSSQPRTLSTHWLARIIQGPRQQA
jgi:hypothetical protein